MPRRKRGCRDAGAYHAAPFAVVFLGGAVGGAEHLGLPRLMLSAFSEKPLGVAVGDRFATEGIEHDLGTTTSEEGGIDVWQVESQHR